MGHSRDHLVPPMKAFQWFLPASLSPPLKDKARLFWKALFPLYLLVRYSPSLLPLVNLTD